MIRNIPSLLLVGTLASTSAFAEDFDLNALVKAAKSEPALSVYDSTGKIKKQAKAFAKKYGIETTGTKIKAGASIKMVLSETKANNVKSDVVIISDVPAASAQLLSNSFTYSYLPEDMKSKIPAQFSNPLVVSNSPVVWSYNTALNDSCPVDNIWALTDPEWKGHVTMPDPLNKSLYTDFFNQFAMHHDKLIADAYQAHYGKPLKTNLDSATAAFVVALAKNQPLLTNSDGDVASAVGAPDTKENFIGIMSSAKYRENKNGMKLGICASMKPMVGMLYPKFMMITKGTDSPNAAKLFVHYMLTGEGFKPQAIDGKISTNIDNKIPAVEPSGVAAYLDQLIKYNPASAQDDWASRQDWQDLWALARAGQL
ncbi:ABC transporter substrate-binding protein [Marinomonas aquiplantarum]|uniref:Iron(III) transport system substrate-binding protein n=1 Tax=Marinomonas aquiplantarum TaxID=491951 RepID=A0A366CV58_9GAMM|nr:ABC transporter substrate-binding protein [Marinomonas aquiplantarum]RBO78447.1 iron(III) transport system substrate-binding protein [Marinomonas aquiplantarum]